MPMRRHIHARQQMGAQAIKRLVKATRRPGADGGSGGFRGLFDLKARRVRLYTNPGGRQ